MEKLLLTLMAIFCLAFTVVAEDETPQLLYTYTPDENTPVYIYGNMDFKNIITDDVLREITPGEGIEYGKTAMDAVVGTQYVEINFSPYDDIYGWGCQKEWFFSQYPYSTVDFTDGKRSVSCGSGEEGGLLVSYSSGYNVATLKMFIYDDDEDFYISAAFHGWEDYEQPVGKLTSIIFYGYSNEPLPRPIYTYIPEEDITIVGTQFDIDGTGGWGDSGATEEDYKDYYHTLISSDKLGNKMKNVISTETVSITFTADDGEGHNELPWQINSGTLHLKVNSAEDQEHHIFEFGKGAVEDTENTDESDYEGDQTELGGQSSTVEVPINIKDIENFSIQAAFTGWDEYETIAHVECIDFFGTANYQTPGDFEYNGVWYHITVDSMDDNIDSEVEVTYPQDTKPTPYSGDINIPLVAYYKDILFFNVTSMGTGAFKDSNLNSVTVESSKPINEATDADNLSTVFEGISLDDQVLLIVPDADDSTVNENGYTPNQQAYDEAGWTNYFVFKRTDSNSLTTPTQDVQIIAVYNLLGQKISEPQHGINIILYSNGSTERVLVK